MRLIRFVLALLFNRNSKTANRYSRMQDVQAQERGVR